MNTKNRIAAIRLSEKLEHQAEYAKKIGISYQITKNDTATKSEKGVITWQSEKSEAIAR